MSAQVENVTEISSPVSGTASVLNNAQNARIKNSTFIINTTTVNTTNKPTLEILYQRVAPNAISNEGGRADVAKCHPGMREEVVGLIEKWRKTAIVKTIAERSLERGVHTINFFFFREDSTRNVPQPMIPTLLYQLFRLFPESSDAIAAIISTHPRVLDGSIAEQCKLISGLSSIIRRSLPTGTPIVLLVDGLDECDVDVERSQGSILHVLDGLVMEKDSPFRLLIASRLEAHIKLAFNQLSSQAQTIFLDEQYAPGEDIRLFVNAEFARIKASHPSARLLSKDWPPLSDVERIVINSSGQFIYAATVMRYLAHASVVPSLSLDRVKGIVPGAKNSPFANLDSIYLFILSRVEDPDATRDILSMGMIRSSYLDEWSMQELLYHYNPRYTPDLLASCASELSALVRLTEGGALEFHHASFVEFLGSQSRSGIYWIDENPFRAKFLLALWERRGIAPGSPQGATRRANEPENMQTMLFFRLEKATPDITYRLLKLPLPSWIIDKRTNSHGWALVGERFALVVYKLYFMNDLKTYKLVLYRFVRMALSLNLDPDVEDVPFGEECIKFYRRWDWWFQLTGIFCR